MHDEDHMNELKLLMLMMIFSLCVLAFGVRAMRFNPDYVAEKKINETHSVCFIDKSGFLHTLV